MSTLAMYGEIVFPAYNGRSAFKVRRISSVKIETSWKSLTDTAEIVLPRKVRDYDRNKIGEIFRVGDPVQIYLGYNGTLTLEFSGYISKAPAGVPLTISCEDEMYRLKRTSVSLSKKNCTLKELLQAVAPGYTIACDETKLLGLVRYVKQPGTQIFEDLKKQGIYCWFEGTTLHAFNASKNNVDPVPMLLEKTAAESLKQKAVEEVYVVIKLLRKAKKALKVEYGEKYGGKHLTREYAGLTLTESEMLSEAKKIYQQAKQPGLDGDVTLFGIPRVTHGMRIKLKSTYYPEKDGMYYIDAVTKTFDNQGYRQQCKLGDKAV